MQFRILSFLLILCSFFGTSTVIGQTKFVNEFLNIGVGARAHGMFGSVVASSDDVTAAYWNPAGLTGIKAPMQFSAMHASWFGGIANYDYGGLARRLNGGKSFMSITMIRMGIDNIPNTLNLIGPDGSVDYNRVTEFSASDFAFLGSYGRKFADDKLSVGASLKIIRRSLGDFGSAWGFGADLGLKYKLTSSLTLAAVARDVTTTFNAWSFNLSDSEKDVFALTGNEIPVSSTEIALPRLILGIAHQTSFGKFTLLSELDVNVNTDGRAAALISSDKLAVDPSLGFELGYNKLVYLRAGFGNIQRVLNSANATSESLEIQPNLGLGVVLGRMRVDYALTNIGSLSGVLVSNIFSLSLDFAPKKSKKPENVE
jgi:hypothetical protein